MTLPGEFQIYVVAIVLVERSVTVNPVTNLTPGRWRLLTFDCVRYDQKTMVSLASFLTSFQAIKMKTRDAVLINYFCETMLLLVLVVNLTPIVIKYCILPAPVPVYSQLIVPVR